MTRVAQDAGPPRLRQRWARTAFITRAGRPKAGIGDRGPMNKHRIGALVAAAALTLTFAGTAFADGSVPWEGNGITNGEFNNEQCDEANPAGTMLWVFSPGGNDSVTAAELTVN